jgi:hypothetical protein
MVAQVRRSVGGQGQYSILGIVVDEESDKVAQRLGLQPPACAFANATAIVAGRESKTQKTPDLAPRKRVGWKPLFGGTVPSRGIRSSTGSACIYSFLMRSITFL